MVLVASQLYWLIFPKKSTPPTSRVRTKSSLFRSEQSRSTLSLRYAGSASLSSPSSTQTRDPSHGDKQGLIIQPVVRLHPGTRYVAVIRGLKSRDGKDVAPLSGFKRLRDERIGTGPDDIHESSLLAGEVDKFTQIFQFLAHQGISRNDLQLAWDFTTGSDEAVTNRLVQMRDEAEAKLPLARSPRAQTLKSKSIRSLKTQKAIPISSADSRKV